MMAAVDIKNFFHRIESAIISQGARCLLGSVCYYLKQLELCIVSSMALASNWPGIERAFSPHMAWLLLQKLERSSRNS